jgi:serine phosphatase RsbU (regulator of sigma subunit)
MKLPFQPAAPQKQLRNPKPFPFPKLATVDLAAQYKAARVGGDFFDVMHVAKTKLLFVLMDIAGKRETALHVAAAAQDVFRQCGTEFYADPNVEDGDAITHLLLEVNRAIMVAANGILCAPAFIGCYDEEITTLSYINAGHTPAILTDEQGTLLLEANGLPLGLFSHSTHDSQFCALSEGASVTLVSKGLVENKSGGQEFGIERVKKLLKKNGGFPSAADLCKHILDEVEHYQSQPSRFGPSFQIPGFGRSETNDITTVVLMRTAQQQSAASAS